MAKSKEDFLLSIVASPQCYFIGTLPTSTTSWTQLRISNAIPLADQSIQAARPVNRIRVTIKAGTVGNGCVVPIYVGDYASPFTAFCAVEFLPSDFGANKTASKVVSVPLASAYGSPAGFATNFIPNIVNTGSSLLPTMMVNPVVTLFLESDEV